MLCKQCGKQILDEFTICPYCGTDQSKPIAPAAPPTPVAPVPVVQPTVTPPVVSAIPQQPVVSPEPPVVVPEQPVVAPEQPVKANPPAAPLFDLAGMAAAAPATSQSSPKKIAKKWVLAAVALFAVLAIVLVCVLSQGGDTDDDDDDDDERDDHSSSDSVSDDDNEDNDIVVDTDSLDNSSNGSAQAVNTSRTIMIYIVGSNLESQHGAATMDIDEMVNAKIDDSKTKVLLCAGGSNAWQNNVISSSETSYYLVTDDDVEKVAQVSKQNMGTASTLTDFVDWSVDNYPSDRYSLFFWNHGGGPIHGYGHDEISNDMLSISELVSALNASPFGSGNKLELIGFDACLMGTVETAWAFKDYARYFIASQEIEPGYGWDYEFLSDLAYCQDGDDIGKAIIDSYFAFYKNLFASRPLEECDLTLSCVDLSKIGAVEKAVNELFDDVNQDVLAGQFATASRCRYSSKAFGKSGTTSAYDLVDLKHIASLLSSEYTEAAALETAVENAVTYTKSNVNNANGLSIYHPYDMLQSTSTINRIYDGFDFADNYTDYIANFVSCLQNDTQSQESYREFSKTMGTATSNGQKSDLSIQLTAEQMATFSSAQYYVFWEMPASETFSHKTEYLQVFSGQDVSVSATGKLTASYSGKAVFGKNNKTGKYSDCPLSAYQIYDGSLEEKFYFSCVFWNFDDAMEVENVNWLMKIKNGTPTLLNAYYTNSPTNTNFPDKQLVNPDNYSIYGFMNNSYFVSTDSNQNTVFTASGSIYGFEYERDAGFSLELRPIANKSQYRAVFVIEDIYGNRYFSDFIPLG